MIATVPPSLTIPTAIPADRSFRFPPNHLPAHALRIPQPAQLIPQSSSRLASRTPSSHNHRRHPRRLTWPKTLTMNANANTSASPTNVSISPTLRRGLRAVLRQPAGAPMATPQLLSALYALRTTYLIMGSPLEPRRKDPVRNHQHLIHRNRLRCRPSSCPRHVRLIPPTSTHDTLMLTPTVTHTWKSSVRWARK